MQMLNDLGQRGAALAGWLTRPANVQQRNVRNVLIDGVRVALVQGVATFLSVFLVRLGATPFMVGLLTSMPALTGMILAIPVGRLLERQRDILPWYSRVRVLVLGSYALTGLVPFLFPSNAAIIAIIAIWAIATVPQAVVNVAFTMVMSAVAGCNQRYYLMSRRWSIMGVTTAITVALVCVFLDMFSFSFNYQFVFIASFAGGMLSFAFSNRIELPPSTTPEAGATGARACARAAARWPGGDARERRRQPFSDQPVCFPLWPDSVDPAVSAVLGARVVRPTRGSA